VDKLSLAKYAKKISTCESLNTNNGNHKQAHSTCEALNAYNDNRTKTQSTHVQHSIPKMATAQKEQSRWLKQHM
jgi:hypothetical protein